MSVFKLDRVFPFSVFVLVEVRRQFVERKMKDRRFRLFEIKPAQFRPKPEGRGELREKPVSSKASPQLIMCWWARFAHHTGKSSIQKHPERSFSYLGTPSFIFILVDLNPIRGTLSCLVLSFATKSSSCIRRYLLLHLLIDSRCSISDEIIR